MTLELEQIEEIEESIDKLSTEDLKCKIEEYFNDLNNIETEYTKGKKDTDEDIKDIESKLNVVLPDDFKWWLKNYDGAECGCPYLCSYSKKEYDIYGEDLINHNLYLRDAIKEYREKYPKDYAPCPDLSPYLVSFDQDDFCFPSLDTSRMKDGICPVILFEPNCSDDYTQPSRIYKKSFLHYIYYYMITNKLSG